MPDVKQLKILDGADANGTYDAYDIRDITAWSVYAEVTGGTSIDISFEGSADPAGEKGFAALAFRQAGGGSYATTAVTMSAGSGYSFYFDPTDNVLWVRAVLGSESGSTSTDAYLTGEQ